MCLMILVLIIYIVYVISIPPFVHVPVASFRSTRFLADMAVDISLAIYAYYTVLVTFFLGVP
jgi:hypothetical protein